MQALIEAKRLLEVLEKQLPSLAALHKELGGLAPHLRGTGQVLQKVEAQPDSPDAWAGELEGQLRALRAEASQLRAHGASRHKATLLEALTRIDALLTSLTRPARRSEPAASSRGSPPTPVPVAPLQARRPSTPVPVVPSPEERVSLPDASAELPRKGVAPPAPRQEELEPYDALGEAHASGPTAAAAMRWSVGALTLASMERPPLSARKPPAPEPEAAEEQEGEATPEAAPPSAGLGPESTKAGRAHFARELLELHLEQLSSASNSRMALLRSREATGSKLATLEEGFLTHADALRWMGAEALQALAERLEGAEDAGSAFAAALPLLTLEGNDTVEVVRRVAESAAPELAEGLIEALRFTSHPLMPSVLEAFSGPEAPAFLRAPALELLVQEGRWEDSFVQAALRSDEPDLVAAAARAVLTAGRAEYLGSLEALMTHPLEAPADVEVLVAASVLGSSLALEQVRARLAQEPEPPTALIRLMAACGVSKDSELLWELARKKGPVAREALWALARLGVASALPRLRELAEEEVDVEAVAEPLRFLAGPVRQPPSMGRVAHGAAWTAQVPVSVLMNPAVPSAEREWAFWELAARTGLHVAIDVYWPWQRQLRAARAWEHEVKAALHRLARGNWLYRGRLSAKGDGT